MKKHLVGFVIATTLLCPLSVFANTSNQDRTFIQVNDLQHIQFKPLSEQEQTILTAGIKIALNQPPTIEVLDLLGNALNTLTKHA